MQTPAITLWFPEQCLLGFFILEKQLASQNSFSYDSNFLLLRISFLYCIKLHPYNHYHFSKISSPFCGSRNWWIIVVFLQSNSLRTTIVSQKYQDFLQPYSHDCFLKNIENFLCKKKIVNNRRIPSTHAERNSPYLSDWNSFTPHLSLSLYSQTELRTEKQIHLLRVGWRNFFSSCAVVSVFSSGEK